MRGGSGGPCCTLRTVVRTCWSWRFLTALACSEVFGIVTAELCRQCFSTLSRCDAWSVISLGDESVFHRRRNVRHRRRFRRRGRTACGTSLIPRNTELLVMNGTAMSEPLFKCAVTSSALRRQHLFRLNVLSSKLESSGT